MVQTRFYFINESRTQSYTDSIKLFLKELFIKSALPSWHGDQTLKREKAYSNLPMFCLATKSLRTLPITKKNAFMLNPLIRFCLSRKFTDLRGIIGFLLKLWHPLKQSNPTREEGLTFKPSWSLLASSIKTRLLVYARLCLSRLL